MGKRSIRHTAYISWETSRQGASWTPFKGHKIVWARGSLWTTQLGALPSACSCRAWFIEIFFRPNTVSSQRFYCIPRQNRSWNKFVPPVFCGKSFFHFLSWENCHRCLHCGLQPLLWPLWLRCLSRLCHWGHWPRAAEGKGEEILLEMEKESLSCRLLSTGRFHGCKLHWETEI